MRVLGILILNLLIFQSLMAQDVATQTQVSGVETYPQISEGLPIRSLIIILHKDGKQILTDSIENEKFYSAFGLRPGTGFKQYFADLAIRKMLELDDIRSAEYKLYSPELSGPVILVYHVYFLNQGEKKEATGKSGMSQSGSWKDFPVITQTSHSKLMFILNGGTGLFNESNAFLSKGAEFTQGNPVATQPAGKGVTFWGEAYLEPGIAGIYQLGKSKFFGYGAATVLVSGRNTTDIYSYGSTIFLDWERVYAGVLAAGLGKNKSTNIDLSVGKQPFQLNDGFLFSKYSGSANAGERGSVYLSSRTSFEKAATLKITNKHWTVQGFFLEPQELFKDKQSNTNYSGGGVGYNNNSTIDAGIYYIQTTGGTSKYRSNLTSFDKKGMYVINPKLWIGNILDKGLFIRSEYAFQAHQTEDMRSDAWYVAAGITKNKWRWSPTLTYRFAFMEGDDSLSTTYERFDPILTGGLGNWVQGINIRKIAGNGNIISHRVELKTKINSSFEVSLDDFLLKADSYSNIGGLGPISVLKNKELGQEFTLTSRYFLSRNFMLLTVLSHLIPGEAMEQAFEDPIYDWTSVQLALFMFF